MDGVLLLHGIGSSNESEKIKWFGDNLDMEVFAPNFPQHGDNEEEFKISLILEQIDKIVLEMEHLDKKYLIGRSFGGYMTFLILKKYPDFFNKVCLMSPAVNMEETMQFLVDRGYVDSDFKLSGRQLISPKEFSIYDSEVQTVDFDIPVLIIQGVYDKVTKVSVLEKFLKNKKKFKVEMFNSGHNYGEFVKRIENIIKNWILD